MDFKLVPISFCKKGGNNVQEAQDKEQIINILKQKYSINFKSNRAMVINHKSVNYVRNPHLISVKTSGTNYFLFLTRINYVNCAFYIDRKIKQGYTYPRIISINYSFDDSVYNDTLLDGELIKDTDDNWMFLISDLIVSEGKLLTCNIINRINILYDILANKFNEQPNNDICPLRVKKLFTYSQYNELITMFIPSLKYGIRGLYFNTLNTKHNNHLFLYPSNKTNNKNQKSNDNISSIKNKKDKIGFKTSEVVKMKTFELRKTIQPEIYDLYCLDNTNLVKYDVARISTLKISKLVFTLFNENETVYVNCKFNTKFNKWEPFEKGESDKLCDIKYLKK